MNLLQMSVSAGILIFAVVILRLLAVNRLPKTMFLALWGIALCRLLIPFSIPARFSIYHVFNDMISRGLLLKAAEANGGNAGVWIYGSMAYMDGVYKPLQPGLLMLLWIAGTAFFTLFFALSFYRSCREIRTALPIKGNTLIDNWLGVQRLKRSIKVLVSDKITTPITYGIRRPKIILPRSMDYGNEPQMKYILTHELIHIKRFDALWKLLLVVALCVHWFNPMVWVLYLLVNRDLELACDEKVVKLFGEDTKSDYALSLIEVAERGAGFTPLYSSFSKNATEERILSIMKFKKTSLFSLVLAFMLVAGATLVFAEGTAGKVLHLDGVIRTDNGSFSFSLGEGGVITVKDAGGKVVSTTTVGSDGKATLTDGSGKTIKTLQLEDIKAIEGKRILLRNKDVVFDGPEAAALPKFTAEVTGEGIVTVKDARDEVICTGRADSIGVAILTDSNGAKMGSAVVNGGEVTRLVLQINKGDAVFFKTDKF